MSHHSSSNDSLSAIEENLCIPFDEDSDDDDPNVPAVYPMISTFVRFSIDPIATIEGVDDPELKAAASAMTNKQYISYVHKLKTLDLTQPYLAHIIILIARGLPEPDEEQCIEQEMCTPIFPETRHPTERPPLRTNKAFPFENCYTYSYLPFAKIKTKAEWRPYAEAIAFPSMEHVRDETLAIDDQLRQRELRAAKQAQVSEPQNDVEDDPEPLVATEPAVAYHADDDLLDDVPTGDDAHQDEEADMNLDMPGIIALLMAQGIPEENLTTVTDLSYDLSGPDDFGQPAEFFEEQAFIQNLIRDSKARAIERARQIDEAAYGETKPPIQEPQITGADEVETVEDEEGVHNGAATMSEERQPTSSRWKRFKRWIWNGSFK